MTENLLHHRRAEVDAVCRRLERFDVGRDLAPTRESFRRSGSRADLVHLAAHGSLRSDNPAYSFVQPADGLLFVHGLGGFRLPASTVVLTACSSGRGVSPAGDEWIGPARGFLQACASTVVASLWPIQDQSTCELMELFYSECAASGTSIPEMLAPAMRRMLGVQPSRWHWASFAALGGVNLETRGGPSARSR